VRRIENRGLVMPQPQTKVFGDRRALDSGGAGNTGWSIGGVVLIVAISTGWVWYNSAQSRVWESTAAAPSSPPAIEINSVR